MFGFSMLHGINQQIRTLTGLSSSHGETLKAHDKRLETIVSDIGVLTATLSVAIIEISERLDELENRARATEARVLGSTAFPTPDPEVVS